MLVLSSSKKIFRLPDNTLFVCLRIKFDGRGFLVFVCLSNYVSWTPPKNTVRLQSSSLIMEEHVRIILKNESVQKSSVELRFLLKALQVNQNNNLVSTTNNWKLISV